MKNFASNSRILNPFAQSSRARITLDVDLKLGTVQLTCNQTLNALVMASILVKATSGILDKMGEIEAMTVNRASLVPGEVQNDTEKTGGKDAEKKNDNSN